MCSGEIYPLILYNLHHNKWPGQVKLFGIYNGTVLRIRKNQNLAVQTVQGGTTVTGRRISQPMLAFNLKLTVLQIM